MIKNISRPFVMVNNNGVIENIAMFLNYEEANKITKAVYGEYAFAEEYNFAVQMGDVYKNGVYYNILEDGTQIAAEYIPTQEEQIQQLQADNELLEQQLRNTQLALTELYEKMEA